METFLKKTAQHLIETYADSISDICIVLPNKRAGLFLKQHFSTLIDKPIWLPEILGAEELIEQLSDVEIIDNVTQLFELYTAYLSTEKEPESFEEFSKWGQILLHDFNEIDRYLIPTKNLFNHINEARALEIWNLGEAPITDFEQQYLNFWKQLGSLYKAFDQHLKVKLWAYQGSAFRSVAENITSNPTQFIEKKIKWKKIVFVGFNALNKAEESIITTLIKQGKAEILWDADAYYLNNSIQESGLFLRAFQKKEVFTPFNWISNKFNTEKKRINILGIPQNIGQAKYITNIINDLGGENNYKDTAVVLADEDLLIPVLQSIPKAVDNINVTMGYPLKNTPLNNFFEFYLTALLNAERFGNKGDLTYHYKDILKIIQLPFSKTVFGPANCLAVKNKMIEKNWVFINKEKIDFINETLALNLPKTYTINGILEQCIAYIEQAKIIYTEQKKEDKNMELELEYLFQFAKLFNQLTTLLTNYPYITSCKSLYSLFRQLLSSYSIELYGEPLLGLQVMGMLETRNIDFKNLILLSANEGVLPAGKSFNSFIPFDIKRAYQLPTHIEKDAVYAYHFYRLLQHSENITILYNTETNEFGSGEQSRFVTQVENEMNDKENIIINKQLISYPSEVENQVLKEVEKTPKIIAAIIKRMEKGISPSALNTYINCPLDYYYKYVLGVREAEEVEETIDASTFGTYLHKVLEILYQPFIGKNITTQDLKGMLKLIPETTHLVFSEDFTAKELNAGKNLLTYNVALNYLKTFIKNEIKAVTDNKNEIYINALEKELKGKLSIEHNGSIINVHLKGFADRIDSYGDTLRIIDYKTGLTEPKDLKLKDIELLKEPNEKNKAFQVLMYAYLYQKENNVTNTKLLSGIISFRKLSNEFMPFEMDKSNTITQDVLSKFEELLKDIFEEMLDTSIPFKHQSEALYCELCD